MQASHLHTMIAALPLDRALPEQLFRQLYAGLKAAILDGSIAPGMQLPPTRDFCQLLAVSRQTVLNAYALLTAEGYLDGAVGRGTFVSADVRPSAPSAADAPGLLRPLSERGKGVVAAMDQVAFHRGPLRA